MLLGAVALGRHHDAAAGVVRVGPLQQEDVGLLAGLEDAELGVDGAARRHDPVGTRLGAAAQRVDVVPGGPALRVVVGVVVGLEVEDETRVDALGAAGQSPAGCGRTTGAPGERRGAVCGQAGDSVVMSRLLSRSEHGAPADTNAARPHHGDGGTARRQPVFVMVAGWLRSGDGRTPAPAVGQPPLARGPARVAPWVTSTAPMPGRRSGDGAVRPGPGRRRDDRAHVRSDLHRLPSVLVLPDPGGIEPGPGGDLAGRLQPSP